MSQGIAMGRIMVYHKNTGAGKLRIVEDTAAELQRFQVAKQEAAEQLEKLYQKAKKEMAGEDASVFEMHKMLLEDQGYLELITDSITRGKKTAQEAVSAAQEHYRKLFSAMEDEYMRGRAEDIRDISDRLKAVLDGKTYGELQLTEPVILLAKDLAPSEVLQLEREKILAFVTHTGSATSHTSILARSMGIPALAGTDFPDGLDGRMGLVDAREGVLLVDPTPEQVADYAGRMQEEKEKKQLLQEMRGKESVTRSGKKIELFANAGSVQDVEEVLLNDGEGIGLFRSEFLFLESRDYPAEEEQFQAYRSVLEAMEGKKVIIRTMDIGGDKKAAYFNLTKEENPAMGYRAVRICLDRPAIFKTQLRAIFRASCYGNSAVMFPMITSVEEVQRIKDVVKQVKADLTAENIPYREIPLGIMIETPAAVMLADELGKEVDFFSVGSNDLAQFTLAADRQNPRLGNLYNQKHPAVLKMLQLVVENGHRNGCQVGICGELASDPSMTETLVKMGFDELSVTPSELLKIREKIRNL